MFVAHVDAVDFDDVERAARAVVGGARLLTANYLPAYAGANGPIFSRGAMVTAGDREGDRRPPDRRRQAVAGRGAARCSERLGVAVAGPAVIGDDSAWTSRSAGWAARGRSWSRSGISGAVDLDGVPERRRPHAVVDGVEEMLRWL